MKNIFKNWLLVLAWMAGILYFSSRPDPIGHFISLGGITPIAMAASSSGAATDNLSSTAQPTEAPHRPAWLNYAAHFSEYTGLMLLLLNALWYQAKRSSYLPICTSAFSIAISFAFIDENYQKLWPGRGFAFSDLAMDLLGIILASILFGIVISSGSIIGKSRSGFFS